MNVFPKCHGNPPNSCWDSSGLTDHLTGCKSHSAIKKHTHTHTLMFTSVFYDLLSAGALWCSASAFWVTRPSESGTNKKLFTIHSPFPRYPENKVALLLLSDKNNKYSPFVSNKWPQLFVTFIFLVVPPPPPPPIVFNWLLLVSSSHVVSKQ